MKLIRHNLKGAKLRSEINEAFEKIYPILKNFTEIRRKIQHPTAFNYIMPLINPVKNLSAQMIGVSNAKIMPKLAKIALKYRKNALFVHDLESGLDDVSICGKTLMYSVKNGIITEKIITPGDYDLPKSEIQSILLKNNDENLRIFQEISQNTASVDVMNFVRINELVASEFFNEFI